MSKVSTSILTLEKEDAVKTFYDLEVAHTDMFHIDIMDGKFVEKNTVELMKDYSLTYRISLIEYISFHIEATKTKERTMENIKKIKENGIKAALAISPDTSIEEIKEYIPYLHMILVMTVIPGKGGQKLIPETLNKVSSLREYITQKNKWR